MKSDDKQFLKKLGEGIIDIRKKKNLKQVELSSYLNMEDSSLRRIEKGRTNPTIMMLRKICKELNISLSELLIFDK